MQRSVFTHGDIGTDNIMVKQDPDSSGQYIVTGIIDWEASGFYPPWPIPRMHCSRSSLADSSQNHMIDRPATGSGDVGCCPQGQGCAVVICNCQNWWVLSLSGIIGVGVVFRPLICT